MKIVLNLLLVSIASCLNLKANAQDLTERNKQIVEIADKIDEYYIFENVANKLSKKFPGIGCPRGGASGYFPGKRRLLASRQACFFA